LCLLLRGGRGKKGRGEGWDGDGREAERRGVLPLPIGESGSGSGGGEEGRRVRRGARVVASGNFFFHFKYCTQFCIAGL